MHRTKNQRLTQNYQRKRRKDQRPRAPSGRTRTAFSDSRKRNVIVTGINLHSYSHTATRRSNQHNDGLDICESTMMRNTFVSFAEENLRVSVDEIEITAIYDLPKRKDWSTRVIVQFLSAEKKPKS